MALPLYTPRKKILFGGSPDISRTMASSAGAALEGRGRPGSMLLGALLRSWGEQQSGDPATDELREQLLKARAFMTALDMRDRKAAEEAKNLQRKNVLDADGKIIGQRDLTDQEKAQAKFDETQRQQGVKDAAAQQERRNAVNWEGRFENLSTPEWMAETNKLGVPTTGAVAKDYSPVWNAAQDEKDRQANLDAAQKTSDRNALINWDEDATVNGQRVGDLNTDRWSALAKEFGLPYDKPEARGYSPLGADAFYRDQAQKALSRLSDYQRTLISSNAPRGNVLDDVANLALGNVGALDLEGGTKPKVDEATMKRLVDLKLRENTLQNRLASPRLMTEEDLPLMTVPNDTLSEIFTRDHTRTLKPDVLGAVGGNPTDGTSAAPQQSFEFGGRTYTLTPAVTEGGAPKVDGATSALPPGVLSLPAALSPALPGPQGENGPFLDAQTAQRFYRESGGDPAKARQAAIAAGYIVPGQTGSDNK